jgi:hypothetical protein
VHHSDAEAGHPFLKINKLLVANKNVSRCISVLNIFILATLIWIGGRE